MGAKMPGRHLAVCAIAGLAALALTGDWLQAQNPAPAQPAAAVDFARDIQPILESRCYACHGPRNARNGLRLDLRDAAMKGGDTGAAIVPGNSEQSLLVRRLVGLDGENRMPKGGDPLSGAQIALIRAWIDQGAAWPQSGEDSRDRRVASPARRADRS